VLLERFAESPATPTLASQIDRPFAIWVILSSLAPESPRPYVAKGRLIEPHRVLSGADRSALETALQMRDQAAEKVTIAAVAVGHRAVAAPLRELLSLGVDHVRLVVSENETITPESAAAAIAATLSDVKPDLILGGAGDSSNQDGLVLRLAAEELGVPFSGASHQVAVRTNDAAVCLASESGGDRRIQALPAAIGIMPGRALRPFSIDGYLTGLSKTVEIVSWPSKVVARVEHFEESAETNIRSDANDVPRSLSARDAAQQLLADLGLRVAADPCESYVGPIENVQHPRFLDGVPAGVIAVLAAESDGRLADTAESTLSAARLFARAWDSTVKLLVLVSPNEEIQRICVGHLETLGVGDVVLLSVPNEGLEKVRGQLLSQSWPELATPPLAVIGEPWCERAFSTLVVRRRKNGTLVLRVRALERRDRKIIARRSRADGKLIVRQTLGKPAGHETAWMSLAPAAAIESADAIPPTALRVQRWAPRLDRFYAQHDIQQLLEDLKHETGTERLTDADFIVDVGYGVGNRDGYEAVIEALVSWLKEMGVRFMVGGSRKVTEELHLLPADRQIGQSGVSVNPQILLAIGVSGAPQHLNYIGARATIIAFNRDPEAPIMTLNQRRPQPKVFAVVGDLFTTVPAFTAALRDDTGQPVSVAASDPTLDAR
jgi:electron transfer flavoprotein alpha subunit